MKKYLLIAAAALLAACAGPAFDPESVPTASVDEVTRVEPLSWWVGMHTPLQLMIQGDNISQADIAIHGSGLRITGIHEADSPNFVFVDVAVASSAKPGTAYITVSKDGKTVKYPYIIREREQGSRERKSYDTSDLIYLLMPDRFANACAANDNAFCGEAYDDGSAMPYAIPEFLQVADRDSLLGRHGGDLQGIIDHLDYIADLGATAVWSTPLLLDNQDFESYHGYAACDYYHIDPRFGDNALYKTFVEKAHEKGLKVIMDIVTNHCGTEHWWMKEAPFKDWYHTFENYTQMSAQFSVYMDTHRSLTDLERQESGWFVPMMPDMNLDNPYVLKYFQQWAVWWVEYSGLDGLRVDTYPYNEPGPMSKWCKAVLEEYPNINIVGECWDYSIPQLAYWQKDQPNKDGFNSNLPSIMDFPLEHAIIAALCEDYVNWDEGMTRVYNVIAQDWVYQDLDNMMIFFANHDHARTADVLKRDPRRMKLAYAMLATIRGIPQIYYGDEMMFSEHPVWTNDGSKRVDFPGGWDGDAIDLFTEEGRAAATGEFETAKELHDYFKTLFTWRKGCEAIHSGKTLHFLSRKNVGRRNITDNTYSYFRYTDTDAVFVYINNALEPRSLDWGHYSEFVQGPVTGRNVITGEEITLQDGVQIPEKSALIVEFKR